MTALNVLVIEDDAMIGMLLAEMLEEMGYRVCAISATEEDAVADAARCSPGLIIVDEHLREGSGVAALKRIQQFGAIPCVHISGAPAGFGRHFADVLQKPFLEKDLVRAIQHVVAAADSPAIHSPAPPHIVHRY